MQVRALIRLAVLIAVLMPNAAAGQSLKQPTGKWIVHFDDAQCVAQRDYGSTNQPLILLLKQPPLGEVMQVSIIEKGSLAQAVQSAATVQFDSQPQQKVSALRFSPKGQGTRVAMMNLTAKQFAPAQLSQSVRLDYTAFHERLALPQLPDLLNIMKACIADLRKIWNVRSEDSDEKLLRKDAKGDLARLFSSEDYPWQSVITGQSGSVKVGLLVDEQGKVADWSVIETSGVAMLDAQSCNVLRERAKFTPALGKDGKPAKDAFIQEISWRLR